jgi:polyhydroxybutyrate depolymerase
MIAFHGTGDEIVPYEGGPSGAFDLPFPAVEDWILQRALKNGCDQIPVTLLSGPSVRGIEYAGCGENANVVFYTIESGGHAWPGGDPMPEWIVGHTTQEIDATGMMWEFFQEHDTMRIGDTYR